MKGHGKPNLKVQFIIIGLALVGTVNQLRQSKRAPGVPRDRS
jgi:hypothetical protein